MKCPHCGKTINMKKYFSKMGAKGGKKSRRVLTPERAKKMVEAREAKRMQNVDNRNRGKAGLV